MKHECMKQEFIWMMRTFRITKLLFFNNMEIGVNKYGFGEMFDQ